MTIIRTVATCPNCGVDMFGEFEVDAEYFCDRCAEIFESEQREEAYQEHLRHSDEHGYHPDGCFYCGGNHPSDCCSSEERSTYWGTP